MSQEDGPRCAARFIETLKVTNEVFLVYRDNGRVAAFDSQLSKQR